MKHLSVIALSVSLLFASCARESGESRIGVMTFNMRYDRPDEGDNNWSVRRSRIARLIAERRPDIIGSQELLHHQYMYMDSVLTDYESVGVARDDGRQEGEYNALFFLRSRFEAVGSGTFWLSENPDSAGSHGWDGACKRIATWAVLRERGTGTELLAVNTHLDHEGPVARREGARLLLRRIDMLRDGRPAVLTGDFNSSPDSEPIAILLADGVLSHSRDIAPGVGGPGWSFTDFHRMPECERQLIDYIFVAGLGVESYAVLPDTLDGGLMSDHAPVYAELTINQ